MLMGLLPKEAISADVVDVGQIHIADAIWSDGLALKGKPVCDSKGNRPPHLFRETYFGRQRSMSCTDTVRELNDFKKLARQEAYSKSLDSPIAVSLVRQYRKDCLVQFSHLTDPNGVYGKNRATSNHLELVSSAAQVSKLSNSVGSLSSSAEKHFCTATIVRISDKKVGLLTAAHCLGTESQDTPPEIFKIESVFQDLTFHSMAGLQINFALDAGFIGKTFNFMNQDIVLLQMNLADAESYLPLASFAMELWEPLLIMGVSPFYSRVRLPDEVDRTLADLTTVSMEPYCVLFGRDAEGGLHHVCQTSRGQSGSPVVALRDRHFYVAGIHSRGVQGSMYGCADDAIETLNSGLSIIAK